jgi:hypothetical protein
VGFESKCLHQNPSPLLVSRDLANFGSRFIIITFVRGGGSVSLAHKEMKVDFIISGTPVLHTTQLLSSHVPDRTKPDRGIFVLINGDGEGKA